jgi:hypothetical protein
MPVSGDKYNIALHPAAYHPSCGQKTQYMLGATLCKGCVNGEYFRMWRLLPFDELDALVQELGQVWNFAATRLTYFGIWFCSPQFLIA